MDVNWLEEKCTKLASHVAGGNITLLEAMDSVLMPFVGYSNADAHLRLVHRHNETFLRATSKAGEEEIVRETPCTPEVAQIIKHVLEIRKILYTYYRQL